MSEQRILAGFILLVKADITPEQAIAAARDVLGRLDVVCPAPKPGRHQVPDLEIRERILAVLQEHPHMPAMRELLPLVSGNRSRVYTVAKSMISEGILDVVKSGRSVGIRVK
jgi:hypothetical protein